MEQAHFIRLVQRYLPWIKSMEHAASELHDRVNQKYDDTLPYGFHLKLAASYVSCYGHLVATDEVDILILYTSAYLHDTLEDTRMTYNDIAKFIRQFKVENMELSLDFEMQIEYQVPEIVYALTNEKGRNRSERANDAYYRGIRKTRFASFIKMCDRLANIRYTTLFLFTNRMLDVYRQEHAHFIHAINEGSVTPIPIEMQQEAIELLNGTNYIVSEETKND